MDDPEKAEKLKQSLPPGACGFLVEIGAEVLILLLGLTVIEVDKPKKK